MAGQGVGEQAARRPNGLVPSHEAVVVVVGLEVVEVGVQHGEVVGLLGHQPLELVGDLEVARQAGER